MFKILLATLRAPQSVLFSIYWSRKIIRQFTYLLAFIIAIPGFIATTQYLSQVQNDLKTISDHLPAFVIENGQLNQTDTNTLRTEAFITDTTYLLYDATGEVSINTLEQTRHNADIVIVLGKNYQSIFAYGTSLISNQTSDSFNNFTNNSLELFSVSVAPVTIGALFYHFIISLLTIIANNLFYSGACFLFFLVFGIRIRFNYLWRSNLFLSFIPYCALAVVSYLTSMTIPHAYLVILIFILWQQYPLLKNLNKN